MSIADDLQAAVLLTATEREALAQRIRDDRKAERAHLYEPAGVTVLEWEGLKRERHELENRLDRTLRQLATTHEELQTAQAALEHLRRGADNL
jgi:uncharacterized coiled-coil DUF342 family protein